MSGGLSRRGFLGGLAASCAMGSGVVRAAGKAETPLLRLGIVSDTHCRLSFDPKNRKTWGHWSTYALEGAFKWFREHGVDAVVHPGDFTEYGRISELEATGISWRRAFPDGKDALGNPVEKLFVRGNHDKMGKDAEIDALIRKDPAKVWKDVFGIDWYTEKVMLRTVKGFTFVLADWGVTAKDLDGFFAAHGQDLPKDRPFFYVQHAPPKGTVGKPGDDLGSDGCGGDAADCTRHLRKYPNCVALSGHSHYSVTLGDQVWQEDFLSVGCGCMQYVWNRGGRDNSWSLPKNGRGHAARCSSSSRQGLYLLVYADRLVLERWDFVNFEKVGPDRVIPLDGTKPYSLAAQRARARAPEFPAGAAIAVAERDFHYRVPGEKWTPERQVFLTFPRAAECPSDEGRVYEYECTVRAEGEEKPLLVRRVLAGGYFLNDARVEKKTIVAFGKDELPAGRKLRFEVRPMDDWSNRGKPIAADYVIEKA